jgi:ribonuclease HI
MGKFYAVVRGRIPGIYNTWSACQGQTSGFPSCLFKSFLTLEDAAEYMLNAEMNLDEAYEKELKVYLLKLTQKSTLKSALDIRQHEATEIVHIIPMNQTINTNGINTMTTKKSHGHNLNLPMIPDDIKPGTLEFFKLDRSGMDPNLNSDIGIVVIYVDGSKMQKVNHLGSGAYCRYNGKDFGLSIPLVKSYSAYRYTMNSVECDAMSSPSMEYLAFSEVLWHFVSIMLPVCPERNTVMMPKPLKLHFVCDFIGVKSWTENTWKAKETHIIKIKAVCDNIIRFLKDRNISVYVQHCNGHANVHGNEMSDLYAKSKVPHDDFPNLIKEISQNLKV